MTGHVQTSLEKTGPRPPVLSECKSDTTDDNKHELATAGRARTTLLCSAAPSSRIVNGADSVANRWPWQLSLQYDSGSGYRHICGASLISESYAITAAHCIDHDLSGNYRVVAGEHDLSTESGNEQRIEITDRLKHQDYNGDTGGFPNDIAVLKFASKASLNEQVQPVTLPSSTSTSHYADKTCYITGWGLLNGGDASVPDILQEAKTNVLSTSSCRSKFSIFIRNYVKEAIHICVHTGDNGACNGDSGGPLVCEVNGQWELAGATSWGMNGCPTNTPSVYVRVSNYLTWIKEKTAL
ncbi:hypothetical protein FSP39_000041 [Pinctada imbricata]|uniref:Peptidase S1 domain-containing protein n=1 Tax=Pinctada imbricata TaxID=66713 RepID=A0AA88YI05_PINIB|nr:hypothetical protein FSP39_000041 [Pinctada imbricata]